MSSETTLLIDYWFSPKTLVLLVMLMSGTLANGQVDSIHWSTFKDDRDDNVYKTIRVGNQEWFAENLKYNTKESWCQDCGRFGRLYKFEDAVLACPKGWHIPTLEEWKLLIKNLGGEGLSINRMKYGAGWMKPGIPCSENSPFLGITTPYVTTNGKIREVGRYATWWTSTLALEPANWTYRITYDKENIECWGFYKVSGFSVRCIKDY